MDLINVIVISIMYVVAIIILAMVVLVIKYDFDIKKIKKEIKDTYQDPIWDEFIKMAEAGQFIYSPENSIKGTDEVFILNDKYNNPRYRFINFGNGIYAIFNCPSNPNSELICVLSSFNIDKARKMYNILKSQVK